uniref:Uncharacterized protein n=1 Tax=Fagus sylvatica TaxID=28930 RepID=A0A2N9HUN7_FAGSY
MKFIVGNQLVTILVEEPISIYNDSSVPYIDGNTTPEASFHSFEFVSVIHKGISALVTLKENKDGFGLGYVPTCKDCQQVFKARRQRTLARVKGRRVPEKRMFILHIRTTFSTSTMVICLEITVQPEDEEEDELILLFTEDLGMNAATNEKIIPPPIRLYRLGEVAGRWTVTPLPKMIQLGLNKESKELHCKL